MKGRKNIICSGFYIENALLFFLLGIFWTGASAFGFIKEWNLAIIVLLAGISLIKPLLRIIKKIFKIRRLSFSTCLSILTGSLMIAIPVAIFIGFFFVANDMNRFIPTFTGLTALILIVTGIGTGTWLYVVSGIVVFTESVYFYFSRDTGFAYPGLVSGITFFIISAVSFFIDVFITHDFSPSRDISYGEEGS